MYSDGQLTPAQLANDARAAGLDFVATTDHNTADAHDAWAPHAGRDLLVILGEEVTTEAGHWLALGLRPGQVVDWRPELIDHSLAQVREVGGLCVAAHPYAPYPSGRLRHPYDAFDAVEVWNGLWTSDRPWNADNEAALAEWSRHHGRRPAVGNSDTHLAGQIGVPHTVVRAGQLTAHAILDGLRAGRSWIAESTAVDVSFTATAGERTATVGDHLAASGRPVAVRARVRGVPSGTVEVHTHLGRVHHESLPGAAEWHTTARESAFVRLEVRHLDGRMAALTNPIVLT